VQNSEFPRIEELRRDIPDRTLHGNAVVIAEVDYREPSVRSLSNKSHEVGVYVQFDIVDVGEHHQFHMILRGASVLNFSTTRC